MVIACSILVVERAVALRSALLGADCEALVGALKQGDFRVTASADDRAAFPNCP